MPPAALAAGLGPSYIQTCMVAISITLEAYEAVSATLPDGYVAQPQRRDSGIGEGD